MRLRSTATPSFDLSDDSFEEIYESDRTDVEGDVFDEGLIYESDWTDAEDDVVDEGLNDTVRIVYF